MLHMLVLSWAFNAMQCVCVCICVWVSVWVCVCGVSHVLVQRHLASSAGQFTAQPSELLGSSGTGRVTRVSVGYAGMWAGMRCWMRGLCMQSKNQLWTSSLDTLCTFWYVLEEHRGDNSTELFCTLPVPRLSHPTVITARKLALQLCQFFQPEKCSAMDLLFFSFPRWPQSYNLLACGEK